MKRANDESQKRLRRRGILDSALALFEEAGGHLSTVAAIAKRSNIAKGTVYLYFKTREEIYLSLLEEFMDGWFDVIGTADSTGAGVDDVVNLSCSYIETRPVFMNLASIFNGILEKNINYETAYSFKANLRDRVFETGSVIAGQFPEISHEMAVKLILRSFALSIGLWQIAEPAPVLRQLLKIEELKLLKIDFMSELKEGLSAMWHEAVRNDLV